VKSTLPSPSPRERPATLAVSPLALALAGIAVLEILYLILRRLGDLKLYVVETIGIGFAAGVVYLLVVYLLEHSREHSALLWLLLAGALLFRLTLLPLAPTLSDDVYRYRWDGLIQRSGWNPYEIAPADPRLLPFRDSYWPQVAGPNLPTIYPPLTQLILRLTAARWQDPVSFKWPFALAEALLVALLAGWIRRTGRRSYELCIYAWNPLVVVEFAGSGHNDPLAMAAVLLAILLIIRRRPVLSTLALSAAILSKLFPVVLVPLWLRLMDWPRSRRAWIAMVAAAALAVLLCWPYRSAWPGIIGAVSDYRANWMNNASLYSALWWISGSRNVAWGIGVAVVSGIALWAAARRLDPLRAAYLLFGAIPLFSQNAFSWYFLWIAPLLCFFPNPAWLLLTILQFLSYHVLIGYQAFGVFRFEPFYLWLVYGPFYALLAFQLIAQRNVHQKLEGKEG
jgi:alpha-1,6-mannosyltransferase